MKRKGSLTSRSSDRCRTSCRCCSSSTLITSQIALPASILLFAATDTTSHLMAQVLQLLCEHPDIQDKVRREILASRNGQDIAYDQLNALSYLDAICKETLRLYVPVGACILAVPLLMQCSRSASLQLQLSCASKCIHGKCIVQSDTFCFLQGVSRLDTTPC